MYLLDANVFIEAKNRYYGFDICPGFWEWMDNLDFIQVASIANVLKELTDGNDELATWAKNRRYSGFFLDVSDIDTQKAFSSIASVVKNGSYTEPAKANFLAKADPWLIAKALVLRATIVTHEQPVPEAKKKVLIPNLCDIFHVPYMNTFDVLRADSISFTLKPRNSRGNSRTPI